MDEVRELAVRTWDLSVEEMRSVFRIDPYLREQLRGNFDVMQRETIDRMGDEILLRLRLPSMVLQDGRVVARYPDGFWQYVKKSIGLPHRCVEIRLREIVSFPDVALPEPSRRHMRVYTEESLSRVMVGGD